MGELNKTLHQLTLAQHVLALLFLLGYGASLGSMFGPMGRLRAALLALLAAAGFSALTRPWEQGVLLVLCAIGGVGLFIATAWLLSRVGGDRVLLRSAPATEGPAPPQARARNAAQLTRQIAVHIARRRRRRARTV